MDKYYCIFFKLSPDGKTGGGGMWITEKEFDDIVKSNGNNFVYVPRLKSMYNPETIQSIGVHPMFGMPQVKDGEFRFGTDGTIKDMIDTVYAKNGEKEYKWNSGKWQPSLGEFSHSFTWEDFMKVK